MKRNATLGIVVGAMIMFGLAPGAQATTYLVWTNGTQQAPYDSWGTAFSNIQDAVNYAAGNDTVLITNGTYGITSEILVTNSIRIESVAGASNTVVRRTAVGTASPQHRIFNLAKTNIVIKGLTIANGYTPSTDRAGGVLISGSGCVIMDSSILNNGSAASYGGGVFASNTASSTVISNCTISGNTCGNYGAGVFFYGANSKIQDCVLTSNQANYAGAVSIFGANGIAVNCSIFANRGNYNGGGAGVFFFDGDYGIVRNCLIARNNGSGVGYDPNARYGSIQNCTIVSNRSTVTGQGGGLFLGAPGATISNSIVYFNKSVNSGDDNYNNPQSASFSSCCTLPTPSGTGNTNADPQMADSVGINSRLLFGSPCIDTARSNSWMSGAKDLDGKNRIINGVPDMGAYEFSLGPITCNFLADTVVGWSPLSVVFTGLAIGENMAGLDYLWDFNNDGTIDLQGADKAVVTNAFDPGLYSVALTVTNAIGESNTYRRLSYILSGVQTAYVFKDSSSPVYPYTNWATAATGIQEAVNAGIDGTVVNVSNGTYVLSNTITIPRGIIVKSVNGPAVTLVNGNNAFLCFDIAATNAVVDGFTVTNGRAIAADGPGGVINRGLLKNCWLVKNTATTGGGALRNWGTTSNCVIQGNSSSYGGVFMMDGLLMDCVITRNKGSQYGGGGIFFETRGFVRNCLISSNSAPRGGGVEFFYMASAGNDIGLENCTIVDNTAKGLSETAGGVYFDNRGAAKNCIISGNVSSNITAHGNTYGGAGRITSTCTTNPVVSGEGNVTGTPLFVNFGAENYRLISVSPGVNVGTNLSWMTGAKDLDGRARIIGKIVDMGAYETPPPAGTVIMVQ